MTKIFSTSSLIITMILALSVNAVAQQSVVEQSKNPSSLTTSLKQLSEGLKESVAIRSRREYGPQKTYVRLKQRDGCNISFQVSLVPSNAHVHQGNEVPPPLSHAEWRLNLADLDLSQLKIDMPPNADFRIIHFATIASKESIEWTGFGVGDAKRVSLGEIDVDEKHASQVAAALGGAIKACRE